ncbi:MAG: alanine--tRNA ligase [Nanoarchaeota archaeon]|nr:alanine--tRNA ligase [Nanoarchaeota archaeon]
MNRKQLIKKYLEFFESKKHKVIANSSLIPENDPTVLFTTAGMHPLVPYLLGEPHPLGKRLCNVQRCIRTQDIDAIGDNYHHTFFEMLGNWSLGDYWKKESINWSLDFLTKVLKIQKEKISVTCFKGDNKIPKDSEAEKIWKDLGITKIKFLEKKDNWWGPAGNTGPCGPDTEIFVNDVEIWNNVFMQYEKDSKGKYNLAKQKNIDTGMGVERTVTMLQGYDDNYLTDCFKSLIEKIEKISGKKYEQNQKEMRIIADHLKAAVFIIAEGITPGNSEQSYVLRRLIRRAVFYGEKLGLQNFTKEISEQVFKIYDDYPELKSNKKIILQEIEKEEVRFGLTLENGLNKFKKCVKENKSLCGKEAFLLYQSFGFPVEMIIEECKKNNIKFNLKNFEIEQKKHQELSRTATAGKFKSGLADNSEATTKLHTAAHLLLASLRQILKNENIMQKGSNITAERLRLDFSFPRKLSEKEIQDIEDLVNAQVQKSCEVAREEMSPEQAKNKGALGAFEKKYGKKVSVYSVGNFSKEICAGPHVKNTCELGHFKIIKEESSSSGVRRIRAVLE